MFLSLDLLALLQFFINVFLLDIIYLGIECVWQLPATLNTQDRDLNLALGHWVQA